MAAVNENAPKPPDPIRAPGEGPEIDILHIPDGPDVQPVLPPPQPPPPPVFPDLPSLEPPQRHKRSDDDS